jgi:hypothetical protein
MIDFTPLWRSSIGPRRIEIANGNQPKAIESKQAA